MQEGEVAGRCVAFVVLGGTRASCRINSYVLLSHLLPCNIGLSRHSDTRFSKFEICKLMIFHIIYIYFKNHISKPRNHRRSRTEETKIKALKRLISHLKYIKIQFVLHREHSSRLL